MNTPLVSVLMTSYNREEYIAEAIESVLVSSYTNFELIIVDDCSSDNTIEIASSYEAKDSRVKVYVNEKNLGDYYNRNKVASYAKGKYLKYVDSDDIIYPHCLQVMVESMEKYPEAGIGFDFFNYAHEFQFPKLISSSAIYRMHFFQIGVLIIGPLGSIYNREFFNQVGKFDPAYSVAADSELNLRAAAKKPVVMFQRDLYWYRQHPNQEKNIRQEEYTLLNYQINKKYLFSENCPLSYQEKRKAIHNFHASHGRKIIMSIIKFRFKQTIKLQDSFKLSFFSFVVAFLPSFVRHKI